MTTAKILSETPMNSYQLRDELIAIKKRDKELNFRANKTEDYLHTVLSMKSAEADELYKKLVGLEIPRLREMHIHKLVELAPTTVTDLKVALQGYTLNVTSDNMKKIAQTIAEFKAKL